MLKNLSESSFATLRLPFESGKQTPRNIGLLNFLLIVFQALLISMEYHFAQFSHYPGRYEILDVHLRISIILSVLMLIYSIPFVYKTSQKIQYIILILTSQNMFSVSPLLLALVLMGEGDVGSEFLILFTKVVLIIGVLVFSAEAIRFYILLKKGAFKRNSKKDIQRRVTEKNMMALMPVLITSGTGLSFTIIFLSRHVRIIDIDFFMSVIFPILIFYVVLCILPEQLVMLYCKFRFKSFNFDKEGNLYPFSEDIEERKKKIPVVEAGTSFVDKRSKKAGDNEKTSIIIDKFKNWYH
ncbi:hypothetical protein [Heyndrickxia acidiproducens]|uniref:hypothetical protein n=1 Tax=Heyndrickxia acidiproducens TaxID=1121084 RepID=UPI00035D9300|nr:hypothetical protein [Heyndrickxia acidiproducens]